MARFDPRVFRAHKILRDYMIGIGGNDINPTAVEGFIGTLNPADAIALGNIIASGGVEAGHPALNNLMNAVVNITGDKDYERMMEQERTGQGPGFPGGDNRNVPIEQAQAIERGQIGAANANALGNIFGGNPGAFTQAFRRPTGWDYLMDPMANFAGQFMTQGFLSTLPNMVANLNQGIARDMYMNRNQRNWSKMMAANDAFRNRYLDIMENIYSGRNKTMQDLVAGMPNIVGSLGDSLKGLNMFNPEGPQGAEDVGGTALISQAVDPTRVDVQTEIDVETQTPLQAALAGKLKTEASSDLFGDEEQAAQQYAQGLGDRVSGIGSGLKGDAEQRRMSAVNLAAANTRDTQAAINKMRNAADRSSMAANFGTGLFEDIGGMFG